LVGASYHLIAVPDAAKLATVALPQNVCDARPVGAFGAVLE